MGSAEIAPGAEGPFPCLEDVTGYVPGQRSGWQAVDYVGAGEATVSWVAVGAHRCSKVDEDPTKALSRAGDNEKRALRRARTVMRRYVVRNQLTRMWTFTYAVASFDVEKVKADMNAAMGGVRRELGRDVAYLYVLELHPAGHGLHVHLVLPRKFVAHEAMVKIWGHGHVQFSDGRAGLRRGMGRRQRGRQAALYLAKYIGKDLGEARRLGEHRYEVGEGFGVEVVRRSVRSEWDGLRVLCAGHGGELPVCVWSSEDAEDWRAPPVRCWAWA